LEASALGSLLLPALHGREERREEVVANVNIYLGGTVAAGTLANRRRSSANFLHVLCLSEEGDHLSMWLTAHHTRRRRLLIKPMNSTGAGSTPAV